ncbi:MAG: ImmA/IrrE family metallo-endopeptidase [Clostridia bacterium]|nr:ImmA/IrrE family metallo-endopeptidase [Clostridia bacterium]
MPNIDYISERVCALTRRYGTRDPFQLCDALHIGVKYKELGRQLKAFFFYQSRIKTIVLNAETDKIIHKILCAHELGHAILHTDMLSAMKSLHEVELFDTSKLTEYEANIFAAELLISDEDLLELLNTTEYSFFQVASLLYVPMELLDFKFRILKSKGYKIEAPYLAQSDFLKNIAL